MFAFIVSCVVRCLSSHHSLGNPIGRFLQTLKMSTNIVRNQICRRRWATRSRPTTPNTIDKCAWREKKVTSLRWLITIFHRHVAIVDKNFWFAQFIGGADWIIVFGAATWTWIGRVFGWNLISVTSIWHRCRVTTWNWACNLPERAK